MNLKRFANVLENKMRMVCEDNMKVSLRENVALNGDERFQLEMIEHGETTGFLVGIKALFEEFQEGVDLDQIVYEVRRLCQERRTKVRKVEQVMDRIMSGEKQYVRQRLYAEVINYDWNQERLEKIPHTRKLDLAIVYRILIEQGEDMRSSILVTNDIAKKLNLMEEDFEYALSNTEILFPAKIECLSDLLGVSIGEEKRLYCLTNVEGQNGAIAMFLSDKVKEFARNKEKFCFLLPSSVHEVLLLEADSKDEKEVFEAMVRNANETVVLKEEWLSNHVYFYNKETDEIEIA